MKRTVKEETDTRTKYCECVPEKRHYLFSGKHHANISFLTVVQKSTFGFVSLLVLFVMVFFFLLLLFRLCKVFFFLGSRCRMLLFLTRRINICSKSTNCLIKFSDLDFLKVNTIANFARQLYYMYHPGKQDGKKNQSESSASNLFSRSRLEFRGIRKIQITIIIMEIVINIK